MRLRGSGFGNRHTRHTRHAQQDMKRWGKTLVLKYIGRRIRVEGARTDRHAYQTTTTATLHYYVHVAPR